MSEAVVDHAGAAPPDLLGEIDVDGTQARAGERQPTGAPVALGRRRPADPAVAPRELPWADVSPIQRWFRHWFSRTVSTLLIKTWFKVRIEGAERLPATPALYCFNHLSWMDPLIMLATFPTRPRLHFYGPKQADMREGKRNRFLRWTTIPVAFSPLKDDLLTSIRRAQAVLDSGANLAISGEGSIHVHEGELLPLQEGAAYIALRARVPIVPVAITGSSWAHFRGQIVVRIGEPIETHGRPTRERIAAYTAMTWHALHRMLADDRNLPVPKWRIERWFTDLFNDWDGGRETAELIHGPEPDEVPIPSLPAA